MLYHLLVLSLPQPRVVAMALSKLQKRKNKPGLLLPKLYSWIKEFVLIKGSIGPVQLGDVTLLEGLAALWSIELFFFFTEPQKQYFRA